FLLKKMKNINAKQKQNLADFFREISVAFISIGGFTAVFDKSLSRIEAIYQMIFAIAISIILLMAKIIKSKSLRLNSPIVNGVCNYFWIICLFRNFR
ncbi:MAG: hypothetical protein ACK41O_24575, partial [Runella zeae]